MDITIEALKLAFGVRQKIRSCIASHCNVEVIPEWSWIFQRFYFYCMFASSCSVLIRDSWPFRILQLSVFGLTVRANVFASSFSDFNRKQITALCNQKPNTSPGLLFFRHLRLGSAAQMDHPIKTPWTEQPRLPFLHFLRRHGGLRGLIVLVGLFLTREPATPLMQQHPGT